MIPGSRDLFEQQAPALVTITEGMSLLRGFADSRELMPMVEAVARDAAFRYLEVPGGRRMSVAMTNCGELGWVSDRSGYRYDPLDPLTGRPWPPMPRRLRELAVEAARRGGFPGFQPDVCLVNRYAPGARLGAHRDRDECDFGHPIVSLSMGLPAVFLVYGEKRSGRARQVRLEDGDAVVFGGPARQAYHGVKPVADGTHPVTGNCRINLTFRRAR